MMKKKRLTRDKKFKFKAAIEAIKGDMQIAEHARERKIDRPTLRAMGARTVHR